MVLPVRGVDVYSKIIQYDTVRVHLDYIMKNNLASKKIVIVTLRIFITVIECIKENN